MADRYRSHIIDISDPIQLEKAATNFRRLSRGWKRQLDSILRKITREINSFYFNDLKRDLQTYPPDRDSGEGIEWESEKQRKYVMMLWRKGKIKLPYQRTKDLMKRWRVRAIATSDGIDFEVDNDSPWRIYVVGKFGMSEKSSDIRKYEEPIQKFHLKTEWVPANRTIQPYIRDARDYAKRRVLEEVTGVLSGKKQVRSSHQG